MDTQHSTEHQHHSHHVSGFTDHDRTLMEKYFDDLQKDASDADKTLQTSVTYGAAGALGLFLTINEKFFHLRDAKATYLMFLSIGLLLLTFAAIMIYSLLNSAFDNEMVGVVKGILARKKDYHEMDPKYAKREKVLLMVRNAALVALITGVCCEVFFIFVNFDNHKNLVVKLSTFSNKRDTIINISDKSVSDTIAILLPDK